MRSDVPGLVRAAEFVVSCYIERPYGARDDPGGLVGASPGRGWAARSHVSVLRALPQYEIVAVATSRPESAAAAGRELGARGFSDARELVRHPEVDLVTVSVRVPFHAEVVRGALEAGKHVYCEWPLARTCVEAGLLLELVLARGVHDAVGLQARYAPQVARARDLIVEGFVGRVTSATAYSSIAHGAGGRIAERLAYTVLSENAAGTLEVACGHTLDTVQQLVGDVVATVSGTLVTQQPRMTVEETGALIEATAPITLR